MWRLVLIIFTLNWFPGMTVVSQNSPENSGPDKPLRIEIPARSTNETYRIIPCGTNGFILFFRSGEVAGDANVNWYFTCYDTNLQQLWVKSIPLVDDLEYRFNQNGRDTSALLFVHSRKSKNPENSYALLRIVQKKGTFIMNTGTLESGAAIGINTRGQAGKIVNVALKQGTSNAFSLGNGNQISVLWMRPDSNSLSVSAVVNRQISKKTSEYYFVRYDTNGLIRREVVIGMQNSERMLTHVRVAALENGNELLLGSYGRGGGTGSTQKNIPVDESTGLFSSPVLNNAQNTISFYNFLELKNASSLIGEEDVINLKKKALKKKKSLAEYSLDFSVLMHDIEFVNDQYILTAEIFSPQYHTESFTDFDFYGRPYTNSYSVFDGYRFYNAIVAGFDQGGMLLWDNNIEIRNLVSVELSQKVVTFSTGDEFVMCYQSDGKIGSKIIRGNEVIEKLDFSTIDLLNPDDKLLSETKGALIHWYGNYFLSYGYQEIKNIALENNNKRLVFSCSKLRFEK
ncbi:MAG: hypothetical protein NTW16_14230 [Bacteroidetes bacterium]|nr:hypothetical protein [Bacteroidota bacterium]